MANKKLNWRVRYHMKGHEQMHYLDVKSTSENGARKQFFTKRSSNCKVKTIVEIPPSKYERIMNK